MALTWAQRRAALLNDCIVSPDVFNPMINRLGEFVAPYQQAMGTETAQRNMHLYLQGLLSHLPSKNAEDIATFINVERLVMQELIGTAPWDHRPLEEKLITAKSVSLWATLVMMTMPCSTSDCIYLRSGLATSNDAKTARAIRGAISNAPRAVLGNARRVG